MFGPLPMTIIRCLVIFESSGMPRNLSTSLPPLGGSSSVWLSYATCRSLAFFRYAEKSFDFAAASPRVFQRLAVIRHLCIHSLFEECCRLVYIRHGQSDVVHASYYAQVIRSFH